MEVAERRAAVLAQWSSLKSAMMAWRHKLGQSQSMQHFKREADEAAAWMGEKMQIACDESYKDPTNLSVSDTSLNEFQELSMKCSFCYHCRESYRNIKPLRLKS